MFKDSRMALNTCFNLMWELFARTVSPGDPKIERFMLIKETGCKILALEAREEEARNDEERGTDEALPEDSTDGSPC